jgi:hypothetical protein
LAHEAVQRLEHEAVAAERHDDFGFLGIHGGVAAGKGRGGGLGVGRRARDDRDRLGPRHARLARFP